MLSFAYQWMGDSRGVVKSLPDYPRFKKKPKCDRALVKELHKLLASADIIIAHNAPFDTKKANARFLFHKLKPGPPNRVVDTLAIARKHFKLTSNKLDAVCGLLGIGRKLPHTGKDMWLACMRGDRKAFRKMARYNAHDVTLLRALFDYLLPWASNLPNLNLYAGTQGHCPSCLSSNTIKRGVSYARSVVRQRYQCKDCGSWHVGERLNPSSK